MSLVLLGELLLILIQSTIYTTTLNSWVVV
nr:MAG TPA: hypothetical protein [Caudoviricetes sp.]